MKTSTGFALLLGLLLLLGGTVWARSLSTYVVLANIDDEKLVLMDASRNKFIVEAKTYCFNFEEGTIVYSTEPLDICVSSTLINKNTRQTCDIWCP